MLTGCRLGEVQTPRWENVDLEAGELRLPDSKTGARMVPLSRAAAGGDAGAVVKPGAPAPARRFFGTVEIDPDRAGRDMGRVAEEVLQHLTTLPGGKVTVTVDIQAELPSGVSDDIRRAVDENCRTLRFKSQGFEEA